MTLERLTWQLDRLVEQGVHNMVVLNLAPTGPTYGSLADQPRLFSDEWWSLWEGLCEHARDRGARLWFYDQIGFSGANLQGQLVTEHPEFMGWSLERALVEDSAGGTTGSAREIPTLRRGFDYLSRNACAALLDLVHGEFERRLGRYLGNVITGSFQDELPSLPTWSEHFPEEFEKRKGYRIEPVLSALWTEGDERAAQVRLDYQQVRAELAEEAFFRPLHDWHEQHGMIVGVDQQSPSRAGEPIGCVRQYADYPRTHRWFSAPGSDHHGEARIHSSLAHHYGRPRTWIESFHSSGWGGTLEETFDWLVPWLLAGATLYDPHAVYYSTRGGWWEWAPPSTCWRQPYWRHYKHFADAVSRLCWLLTRGAHRCDVGVLFPGATVQAGTLLDRELPAARRAHRTYLDLVGRMVWYDMHPGVLDRSHRDFDVLDDDTVATASVNDGALRTRDEAYRAVILPACDVVLPDTARVLAGFAEAGGLLISVGPEDAVAESLRPHVVRVDSAEDVAGVLEERLGRRIEADGPALHRQVGDRHVLLVPAAAAGSATAQPMLGAGETWHSDVWTRGYDFDPARYRASVPIRLPRGATDVEQWDPQSGRAVPVDVRPVDDGVEVTATFEAPAAVLVWRDAPQDSTPAGTVPAQSATDLFPERIELDGPWESELVPTIDNRYGDFALPAATGPFPVQQWRLAHRRENADEDGWDEVLVGHGTFAWLRGAGDDDDWRPVRYSLTRGIENDPAHNKMLGPKARVPEEFWSVDRVERGQSVELRTHLPVAEERNVWLAIGTAGVTEVWWNGDQLGPDPGGYLRLDAVRARTGNNELRVRVTAERTGPLRGYWALTVDPHAYVRPIWLEPGDAQAVGSTVRAHGRVTVEPGVDLATATLQL
ncbi:MAG TPA: glycosyl hydrolase, partial [Actinopolymorphaceae bacterium]